MVFITKENTAYKYILEAKKYKSIPKAEQLKIYVEFQETKDERIKNRLINSNLMWVVKLARKYCRNEHHLSDLINHGNIGLIEAFDKFDPTKNMTFTSYSTWYIEASIKTYFQFENDVYIPDNVIRLLSNVQKIKKLFKKENKEDDISIILNEYNKQYNDNVDKKYYFNVLSISKKLSSTDDNLSNDQTNTRTVGDDLFTDSSTITEMNEEDDRFKINGALNELLDEREKLIIEYKFGFRGDALELSQISDKIGLTRERIGQIYIVAMEKLSSNKELIKNLF